MVESKGHSKPREIITTNPQLSLDDLIKPHSQFVLVEGPPGIGKSTLCQELCTKWDTLKSLQKFKVVLHFKLRERRIQNVTSVHEIFLPESRAFCQKIKLQKIVDEFLHCEGDGVLLILDGLDEIPNSIAHDKHSLIMELISCRCIPKATRLITSRPSALHLKSKFPKKYRHIEILGWTDESKVTFAEMALKSDPDIFSLLKAHIFSNPVIDSFMYIPLNCAIVVQVYKEIKLYQKLMPQTMTQLYTTLV